MGRCPYVYDTVDFRDAKANGYQEGLLAQIKKHSSLPLQYSGKERPTLTTSRLTAQ
jgi:hypothetical protein